MQLARISVRRSLRLARAADRPVPAGRLTDPRGSGGRVVLADYEPPAAPAAAPPAPAAPTVEAPRGRKRRGACRAAPGAAPRAWGNEEFHYGSGYDIYTMHLR